MLIKANPFGYCHNFILGKFFNNFFFSFVEAKLLEEMQTQSNQARPQTADVRKENRKLKKDLQRERESHRRTKMECDQLKSTKERSKPTKKEKVERKEEKIVWLSITRTLIIFRVIVPKAELALWAV